MHGTGIYPVNGTELFGKPLYMFQKELVIPRNAAGMVQSGNVPLHFMPSFPPFANLLDQSADEDFLFRVSDMVMDCTPIFNVTTDSGINKGSYNVTYTGSSFVIDDYVAKKNLSGTIPGDDMGYMVNMFNLHHTACDNTNASSSITTFRVIVRGVGIYTGFNPIDYL